MTAASLNKPADRGHASVTSNRFRSAIRTLFNSSGALTITGFLMAADIVISLIGLVIDATVITGAPAWLKPLKFAISTFLFSLTVAFMIGCLHRTRRFAIIMGRAMAAALVLEIALIDMQAARHTVSHFNVSTRFDAAVFSVMGMGIGVLSLTTIALFVATCVEKFQDRSLGWSIRLGLLLAILGMSIGGLMTLPTPEQLAAAHSGAGLPRVGAHAVGAPDGGPSLPLTGWSADHGDLRIAHFIGLHAMQILLLTWWLFSRRRQAATTQRTALIFVAALSCLSAFATVLWQALRGQPLLKPDAATLATWALWLLITLVPLIWIPRTNAHPNGGITK